MDSLAALAVQFIHSQLTSALCAIGLHRVVMDFLFFVLVFDCQNSMSVTGKVWWCTHKISATLIWGGGGAIVSWLIASEQSGCHQSQPSIDLLSNSFPEIIDFLLAVLHQCEIHTYTKVIVKSVIMHVVSNMKVGFSHPVFKKQSKFLIHATGVHKTDSFLFWT